MATVIFYNFILLSSTFFVWASEKGKGNLERYFFLGLAFLLVFLPSAIRYGVGADYFNYVNIYQNLEQYEWMESGFYYVNYLLSSIGAHFQWSFAAFAFLFSYAAFKAYPRKQAWLIHLVFFAVFYLLSFFYVRTAVAVGFSLWGLHVFLKGKTFQFLLLIGIASLFHKSTLLVGFVGLLSLVPLKAYFKSYVFPIIAVVFLCVALFKSSVLFAFAEWFLNVAGLTKYANYFNSSKWMDTRNLGSGLGVLSKILFCLYVIFNTINIVKLNERYWSVVVFIFIYALATILNAQIVIFGRLVYMFIFAIPYAAYILYNLPNNKAINRVVVILFILISIAGLTKDGFDLGGNWGESLLLNPYQTIFSE